MAANGKAGTASPPAPADRDLNAVGPETVAPEQVGGPAGAGGAKKASASDLASGAKCAGPAGRAVPAPVAAASADAPAPQGLAQLRHDRDAVRHFFETGQYPYKSKIRRKDYERHKAELQVELRFRNGSGRAARRSSFCSKAGTPPARAEPSSASWST